MVNHRRDLVVSTCFILIFEEKFFEIFSENFLEVHCPIGMVSVRTAVWTVEGGRSARSGPDRTVPSLFLVLLKM
jgi:hypothetical protein